MRVGRPLRQLIAATLWDRAGGAAKAKYKLRKQTVEPVFGIIKQAVGIRQFPLRGIEKVRGEWQLVVLACNCRRLHALALG